MDMNISVSEGAGSVGINITASGATFVEVFLESGLATGHTYNLTAVQYVFVLFTSEASLPSRFNAGIFCYNNYLFISALDIP